MASLDGGRGCKGGHGERSPVKRDLPGCTGDCPAGQFFIILPVKSERSRSPIVKLGIFVKHDGAVLILSPLYFIAIFSHLKMVICVD